MLALPCTELVEHAGEAELLDDGYTHINIRHNQLADVTVIELQG